MIKARPVIFLTAVLCVVVTMAAFAQDQPDAAVGMDPDEAEAILYDIDHTRKDILSKFHKEKGDIEYELQFSLRGLGDGVHDQAKRIKLTKAARRKINALKVRMRKDINELNKKEREVAPWKAPREPAATLEDDAQETRQDGSKQPPVIRKKKIRKTIYPYSSSRRNQGRAVYRPGKKKARKFINKTEKRR